MAGNPEDALALRAREERIHREHPDRPDFREAARNETKCPHCGAVVNPVTGDGLHAPEAEPWLLPCDRCQGAVEPDF